MLGAYYVEHLLRKASLISSPAVSVLNRRNVVTDQQRYEVTCGRLSSFWPMNWAIRCAFGERLRLRLPLCRLGISRGAGISMRKWQLQPNNSVRTETRSPPDDFGFDNHFFYYFIRAFFCAAYYVRLFARPFCHPLRDAICRLESVRPLARSLLIHPCQSRPRIEERSRTMAVQ